MSKTKVTIQATKAIFDPNDEGTQKFNEQTTMVQVFQDDIHMANLKLNDDSPYFANLRPYYVFEFADEFA